MSSEPTEDVLFVRCPLCGDVERPEDIVGGVCLTCADAIAFSQNARRGAVSVGDPTSPDPSDAAVTEPPQSSEQAAIEQRVVDAWKAGYDHAAAYRDAALSALSSTPVRPDLRAAIEFVLDYVDWDNGDMTYTAPHREAFRAAIRSTPVRPDLTALIREHLVPWFRVGGDTDLIHGAMRRCLLCGRTSGIVDDASIADVHHEADCAVVALGAALRAEQVERPDLPIDSGAAFLLGEVPPDDLGFADLLTIAEALIEHYPPDTIVCSHHPKADIGARTSAAIADLIASCRLSDQASERRTG